MCRSQRLACLKKTDPESLATGIKEVLNGGAPMTGSIAKKVLQIFAHKEVAKEDNEEQLTKREIEILKLLVKGSSYKMIAAAMFIAIETVRSHIKTFIKNCRLIMQPEPWPLPLIKN